MRSPGYLLVEFAALLRSEGFVAALLRSKEYVRVLFVRLTERGSRKFVVPKTLHKQGKLEILPICVDGPIISLLMPVFNTPANVLEEAIQSVFAQSYPAWELCICDDASTDLSTLALLESFRGLDPRLKIVRSPGNEHISRATNRAAELATGGFIGFLDHDDLLTPDALEVMANAIIANSDADVLYSDEDKLEPDGRLSEPYMKPDWSPEHLESVAYILHLMLVRKSLYLALDGLREECTGAQDYDFSLRATERARKVLHVNRVLYHWRKIAGSAAAVADAKPKALANAEKAVVDNVRRSDPRAEVTPGLFYGSFRVKWPVDLERPVTLLMLTDGRSRSVEGRGEILLVENAINSIFNLSTFKNFRIIVFHNGNLPPHIRERLEAMGVQFVHWKVSGNFNYPEKVNAGLKFVKTEDVIILNDDIEVISPDWIEALLAHSRREEIGVVGARLLYPNGRIQHAGVVLGVAGVSTHIFHNQLASEVGYCGYSHVVRNYSAVTGAVMATRMSLVENIGGFDPIFRIDYNDVDFCLRLGQLGYRTVYTPHATLYHFEGGSLPRSKVDKADYTEFVQRWAQQIERDPFYNSALPKDRTDCWLGAW